MSIKKKKMKTHIWGLFRMNRLKYKNVQMYKQTELLSMEIPLGKT